MYSRPTTNHNNRRHGHITQIVPNSSSPFTHFLAAVGGQVEHEHGEKGDAHAGYYEVDSVEERLAPHRDVESNIEVGLGAACVIPETRRSKSVTYSTPTVRRVDNMIQKMGLLDVADGGHFENVPLYRHVELGEVHADLHFGPAKVLVDVSQVNL